VQTAARMGRLLAMMEIAEVARGPPRVGGSGWP